MVISVALDDVETARGRVSIHLTLNSEGVCTDDDDICGNVCAEDDCSNRDGAGCDSGKSFSTEDDTGCVGRGRGGDRRDGVYSIIPKKAN